MTPPTTPVALHMPPPKPPTAPHPTAAKTCTTPAHPHGRAPDAAKQSRITAGPIVPPTPHMRAPDLITPPSPCPRGNASGHIMTRRASPPAASDAAPHALAGTPEPVAHAAHSGTSPTTTTRRTTTSGTPAAGRHSNSHRRSRRVIRVTITPRASLPSGPVASPYGLAHTPKLVADAARSHASEHTRTRRPSPPNAPGAARHGLVCISMPVEQASRSEVAATTNRRTSLPGGPGAGRHSSTRRRLPRVICVTATGRTSLPGGPGAGRQSSTRRRLPGVICVTATGRTSLPGVPDASRHSLGHTPELVVHAGRRDSSGVSGGRLGVMPFAGAVSRTGETNR